MSTIVGEVNCRVIELIEEIISSSNGTLFVTVPMVLTELLARYSVNGLDELGISCEDVPALKFLRSINQKIQLFLSCYIAENAILALSDIERNVCSYLRKYNFPSIVALKPAISAFKTHQEIDPNEIDLEDLQSNSISKSESCNNSLHTPITFEDFGIGNLSGHPSLQEYFPSHLNISRVDISCQNCLDILTESIFGQFDSVSMESFTKQICTHYHTNNLSELGVFINPTKFENLVHCLSDMVELSKARNNLSVKNYFAHIEKSKMNESTNSKRPEKKVFVQSLTLKAPQDSSINQIFNRMGEYFKEKSAFSPSVSAIRQYLEQNYFSTSSSSKRRKIDTQSSDEQCADSKAPFINIAAEYFFLHYGNKRDISKRYDLTIPEDIANAERIEQQDNSDEVHNLEPLSKQEMNEDGPKKETGKREIPSIETPSDNFSCNYHISVRCQIPFEAKRFSSSTSLPQYLQDEAASLIWHISNDQLQDILVDIQIPPLPPSMGLNYAGFDGTAQVKPQEMAVAQQIGRIGECIVYHYLKRRFHDHLPNNSNSPLYHVQWLNETEDNRAAYDLTIDPTSSVGGGRIFVEVKSSRYEENNVFQLSLWEWQFLTQQPTVNYHIYRVFSAQDRSKTRITVLTNVRRLVEMGRVQLCLSI